MLPKWGRGNAFFYLLSITFEMSGKTLVYETRQSDVVGQRQQETSE